MSTTFQSRKCHTFEASQKELEELERALQGLEQAMNGKWFPGPTVMFLTKARGALRRLDTLIPWSLLQVRPCTDRKKCKKCWGKFGELAANSYGNPPVSIASWVLTVPLRMFFGIPYGFVWVKWRTAQVVVFFCRKRWIGRRKNYPEVAVLAPRSTKWDAQTFVMGRPGLIKGNQSLNKAGYFLGET